MKKKVIVAFILVLALVLSGCGGEKRPVLTVFNWGEYIDESLIKKFEQETGIKVNYETFSTNEDMFVKVSAGGSAYDVVIPSDYMIEKMIRENLLMPLDFSKIPSYTNIKPIFRDLVFDPQNQYSVPYFWGTVGILYNTEKVKEEVDSWAILWDEKYRGQILMLDSQRDALAVALKKLGYSMNTKNEEELEKAKNELIRQKPLVLAYVVDEVRDKMLSGEASLSVAWSGDAMDVILNGETFDYVVPKEGSNFWIDSMVIPKNAKNPEAAHLFIEFMTRPENAAQNSEYIGYSTANAGAMELLPEELRESPVAYPDDETIARCEIFRDPGEFISVYNRIWTEVIAR